MHKFLPSSSLLVFISLLIVLSYLPGLSGDFEFDDQANLLSNQTLQISTITINNLKLAALSGDSGPLGRPISMASFALNHAFTGFDPYYLKLTNVVIHSLAGVTLYFFIVQLMHAFRRRYSISMQDQRIAWIALLTAAAWSLHPVQITSVLYIVQRMTSLAGLFSVLALYFYVLGRNKALEGQPKGWWLILIASPIAGLMAIFSKESAGILPLLAILIEWFFFRFQTQHLWEKKLLHGVFIIAFWLPLSALCLYLLMHPGWFTNVAEGRGFTFTERLMTESRVIWLYIRMILMPDISLMGIYHDDIAISTGILKPVSTLAAIIGLAFLGLLAFFLRHRAPMLAFGIAWFFAGHLMESGIVPLEIAHEHRNYLPAIGPVLAGFYYLLNSRATQKIRGITYGLALSLIAMLAFSTHVRAKQWGDLLEHAIVEVQNHPGSPRAQQQLGRMYFKLYKAEPREEFYEKAKAAFDTASALDPNFKSGLYARIILDFNAGRIPDHQVINEFRDRLIHRRREPGDITMFESLLKCQLSGDCKLSDHVFIDFLEIEAERYKGDLQRKASFLSFLGAYAAQKMDDEKQAGKYLKLAVDIYPEDVQGRLNYAWFLNVIGDYDEAEAQIAAAQLIDSKLNKYSDRISGMEKSIQVRKLKPAVPSQ